MTVIESLAQLVAINSVSARSNLEIVDYLARRVESIGFTARRFGYVDERGVEKQNLVALAGDGLSNNSIFELTLVGHTDTVPYDPQWSDALALRGDQGKLYGRGACDTKAFIAASLAAVERIGIARLRRPLAFVFTADEEVGLIGAKRLAELQPFHARFSIVGEPTSLRPIRAGKGYCLAEVIVRGREAHSAYPEFGTSAIFNAARLIGRLEGIAKQLEADTHQAFDPPFTTLNIGLIRGGTAKNVIPGECKFALEWRPVPQQSSERLLDLIDVAIKELQDEDNHFVCEVVASRSDSGFETAESSRLVKLLENLTKKSAGTVAFGTEAAQMGQLGAEAVVFGPGDIRVAHRTGEFVPISELNQAVEIIAGAVESLCC